MLIARVWSRDPDQSLNSRVWKQLLASLHFHELAAQMWRMHFTQAFQEFETLQNLTAEVSQSKCHFGYADLQYGKPTACFTHCDTKSPKPEA